MRRGCFFESVISLSFAFFCCVVVGCRSDKQPHPLVNETPQPAVVVSAKPAQVSVPAEKPSAIVARSAATSSSSATGAGSGLFLVGEQGGAIVERGPAGPQRVVIPSAVWWLYDEGHELIWAIHDHVLSVTDLRRESPPIPLAKGLDQVAHIWVEWTEKSGPDDVRDESDCESFDAVEVKMRDHPALRLVASDKPHPFLAEGLRWLKAQAHRTRTRPSISERRVGFALDAARVGLPKSWAGCDDQQRCGRAAPFGSTHLQLVLVGDKHGADCWQRSCLLFNPDTREFSSPPVIENSETLDLSTAARPARWTSANDAQPGICGPYYFDASGTAFLVRNYLCNVNHECQDLGASGIGWLEPGAIIGEPG